MYIFSQKIHTLKNKKIYIYFSDDVVGGSAFVRANTATEHESVYTWVTVISNITVVGPRYYCTLGVVFSFAFYFEVYAVSKLQ